MADLTLKPGVLKVASSFPDPPFEVNIDDRDTGFDIELMQLIYVDLKLAWQPVKYTGDDAKL
jgi:ABC-type amino acid transport substrate-binding protein